MSPNEPCRQYLNINQSQSPVPNQETAAQIPVRDGDVYSVKMIGAPSGGFGKKHTSGDLFFIF